MSDIGKTRRQLAAKIKKRQLVEEKSKHTQQFIETYQLLVNELIAVRSEHTELISWKNHISALSEDEFGGIIQEWATSMNNKQPFIDQQNTALFLQNLPSLKTLYLPDFWMAGYFTENSKTSIWGFLRSLTIHTKYIIGSGTATGPSVNPDVGDLLKHLPTSGNPDLGDLLKHLPTSGNPDLGDLFKHLPTSMMDKIKDITDKYSNKVENGELKLENLKFNEISQEFFDGVDPDDMAQVVKGVSGMLEGVLAPGGK